VYQRHTRLVTEEQSGPHRSAEAHLADRPVTSVIRPIDTPQSGGLTSARLPRRPARRRPPLIRPWPARNGPASN